MRSHRHHFYSLIVVASMLLAYSIMAQTYHTDQGKVRFESSAILENVKASSGALKGAVDFTRQTFAFSVVVNTFQGFNSELQKEHFFENYMETPQFPKATFTGKLIDPVMDQGGVQKVRAKGTLSVHGISKERILEVELNKVGGAYLVHSTFNIALNEHNIVIPKLVFQKIAETIQVTVEGTLKP